MKKKLFALLFVLLALFAGSSYAQEIEVKSAIYLGYANEDGKSDYRLGFAKKFTEIMGLEVIAFTDLNPTSKEGSGDAGVLVATDFGPVKFGGLFGAGFDAQAIIGENPTTQQIVEAVNTYGNTNLGYMLSADLTKVLGVPIAITAVSKKRWAFDGDTEYISGVDYYAFVSYQFGK